MIPNDQGENISYSTASNNSQPLFRAANMQKEQIVTAYIISNNLQNKNSDWIQNLLDVSLNMAIQRTIISGQVEGVLAQGKIVCACRQVSENTIKSTLQERELYSVDDISQCTGAWSR